MVNTITAENKKLRSLLARIRATTWLSQHFVNEIDEIITPQEIEQVLKQAKDRKEV